MDTTEELKSGNTKAILEKVIKEIKHWHEICGENGELPKFILGDITVTGLVTLVEAYEELDREINDLYETGSVW